MTPPAGPGVADLLEAAGCTRARLRPTGDDPPPAPDAVEEALRALSGMLDGADGLRRATVRAAVIAELEAAGVRGAARLADAALEAAAGPTAPRDPDDAPPVVPGSEDPEALLAAGREILDAPDQLALVRAAARRMGYAGDTAPVELIWLVVSSRLLPRPVNVAVVGPSAAGKSHTVDTATTLHPPEAVYVLTAASERALIYTDEDLRHRYVVVAEAAGLARDGVAATIIRELAWGARGLRYVTVESVDGELRPREIVRPGPTGLLTTTTRQLDAEVATRLLTIQIPDDPAQTRAVMDAIAAAAETTEAATVDTAPWHAAARWLAVAGERRVVVPYARRLAALVPADDVRMRRDLSQVLAVVRVHAMVHQRRRPRTPDGAVVATAADYAAAHRLLGAVLAVTVDEASEVIRETVAAVAELSEGLADHEGVSTAQLARRLGVAGRTARWRAQQAVTAGYLRDLEARPRQPMRLRLGDPLPARRAILPAPEVLFGEVGAVRDDSEPADPEADPVTLHPFCGNPPDSDCHVATVPVSDGATNSSAWQNSVATRNSALPRSIATPKPLRDNDIHRPWQRGNAATGVPDEDGWIVIDPLDAEDGDHERA